MKHKTFSSTEQITAEAELTCGRSDNADRRALPSLKDCLRLQGFSSDAHCECVLHKREERGERVGAVVSYNILDVSVVGHQASSYLQVLICTQERTLL